jgi:hypothetical protein
MSQIYASDFGSWSYQLLSRISALLGHPVVWATGFGMDFRWIKLPVFDQDGQPIHYRGVVKGEPGLYFIGLLFLYTLSSVLVGGVGRDAEYIARHIAAGSAVVARAHTSGEPQGETAWQSD